MSIFFSKFLIMVLNCWLNFAFQPPLYAIWHSRLQKSLIDLDFQIFGGSAYFGTKLIFFLSTSSKFYSYFLYQDWKLYYHQSAGFWRIFLVLWNICLCMCHSLLQKFLDNIFFEKFSAKNSTLFRNFSNFFWLYCYCYSFIKFKIHVYQILQSVSLEILNFLSKF